MGEGRYAYMHVHMSVENSYRYWEYSSINFLLYSLRQCLSVKSWHSRISGTWLTVCSPDISMDILKLRIQSSCLRSKELTPEPSPQPILSIFLNDETNIHQVFSLVHDILADTHCRESTNTYPTNHTSNKMFEILNQVCVYRICTFNNF